MKPRNKKIIAVLLILTCVVFYAVICLLVGRPMLRFVSDPDKFRNWIDSKGFVGRLVFVAMVVFQIIFAVIPGEPLEIGAGYTFGAIEGTILCIIGSIIGSTIVFVFVKKIGTRAVEIFYPLEKINNLKFLKDKEKLDVLAFVLFLIPGTPKDILVYFLGLTKISPVAFLLTASIARLPSIVTSAIAGGALGSKNYIFAAIVFLITALISIVGLFAYEKICKHHQKNSKTY